MQSAPRFVPAGTAAPWFVAALVVTLASRANPADGTIPSLCAWAQGEALAFCERSVGAGTRRGFARFVEATRGCTWSTIEVPWGYYAYYTSEGNYTQRLASRRASGTDALPLAQCARGAWTTYRVGPLSGDGGFDFHEYLLPLVMSGHRPRRRYWVSVGGMPMDAATGAPLGWPPIHVHHTHLGSLWAKEELDRLVAFNFPGNRPPARWTEWPTPLPDAAPSVLVRANLLDVHGDRQCAQSQGGVACMIHRLPDGYGIPVDSDLYAWGILNDVTSSSSLPPGAGGAGGCRTPRSPWYFVYGMEWSRASPEPRTVATAFLALTWPCLADGGVPGHTEDYRVPALRVPSAVWQAYQVVEDGDAVRTFAHAHQAHTIGVYATHGLPVDIGLPANQSGWTAWPLPSTTALLAAVRRRMWCGTQEPRMERGYDRFVPLQCESLAFRTGSLLTVTTLLTASHSGRAFRRMHTVFYVWYRPLDPGVGGGVRYTYPFRSVASAARTATPNAYCAGTTS